LYEYVVKLHEKTKTGSYDGAVILTFAMNIRYL